MPTHGKVGEFDSTQETWDSYVERLELYFVANDIEDAVKKRAVLLTVVGTATYKLIRNLAAPAKPAEKNYSDLVSMVKTHYVPVPSVMVQRFKFHSRVQQQGETVAAFMAALRQLTEHCEFGTTLEDMLRDRLVCGIANATIQRRLLAESKLTLKTAMDLAQAMEAADQGVEDLQKKLPKESDVNAVRTERRRPGQRQGSDPKEPCHRCGGKHSPRECRFRTETCHACKKRGHIAKMCRSKSTERKDKRPRPQHHTRMLQDESEDEEEEDDQYSLHEIKTDKANPIEVEVVINDARVTMQVDTGASVSLMSEEAYKNTWTQKRPTLEPSTVKLRTYSGEQLKVLGNMRAQVEYKEQKKDLPLLVVAGKGPALLGRDWLQHLKLDWQQIHSLQHNGLDSILQKHAAVFQEELGELKGTKAKIFVDPTVEPQFHKPRPVPFALKQKVEEELERLQKEGIVQPVQFSDWAAPIVPVVKQDGSVRICGDYRLTVNRASKLDSYPLPRVEDLFAAMAGGKLYTKLDLQHAYQQLTLDDDSKPYTVINTHRGLFQYNRLPFGVSSAPGIFQRAMDSLLQGMPHVAVYVDDILLTGENTEDHLATLDAVLQRLETAGMRLKRKKCTFVAKEVEYLGHKINAQGLHPTQEKVKAIRQAPTPSCVTELKSFLGLLSYYSKFLPNMATMLAPLYALLQKDQEWTWTEKEQAAFDQAKSSLQGDSLLVHYNPKKELTLSCDASPYGLGAVLSQYMENGEEKPVGFTSRTLAPAERNYSQLEKEALAIIFGVKKFHNYLYGRHFEIRSDHKPLERLLSETKGISAMASSRIQRWALILGAYEYTITYRPGKEQAPADALSRLPLPNTPKKIPTPGDLILLTEKLEHSLPVTKEQIATWTSKDPTLSRVKKLVQSGWTVERGNEALQPYLRRKDELSVMDGCLLWGSRVVIPPKGREAIIEELHDTHPGIVRMKSLARSYVWWPSMNADLEERVKCCSDCQTNRPMPVQVPLHPWEWPAQPWTRLHLDYAGPFMEKMFLVLTDSHSKWMDVIPVKSATSAVTIQKLRNIFAVHGLPRRIVTDNGTVFTSSEFEEFMKLNGIQHLCTAPYHPASNGLAERAVQTFKLAMKKMKGKEPLETKLARFLFKYRITPHATTGQSPAEMLLGRRPRSVLDLLHPDTAAQVHKSQSRQKRNHDLHVRERTFTMGDRVYVRNFVGKQKWLSGTITQLLGPRSFQVKLSNGKLVRRHVDHIRICHPTQDASEQKADDGILGGPGFQQPELGRDPAAATEAPAVERPPAPAAPAPVVRRSTRVRRPPDRFC